MQIPPDSQAPTTWSSAPVAAAAIVALFAIAAAVGGAIAKDSGNATAPDVTAPAAITEPAAVAEPAAAISPADAPAYSVFVDEETRFAFIKLASGQWKFVRQLDPSQVGQLHPTTLVATRRADVETVADASGRTELH